VQLKDAILAVDKPKVPVWCEHCGINDSGAWWCQPCAIPMEGVCRLKFCPICGAPRPEGR